MDPKDQADIEEFVKHPLNAHEFNPDDPLFEGLQVLKMDADPEYAAKSFLESGLDYLKQPGKGSIREAIAALSEGINKKCKNNDTNKKLYFVRANSQITLENFGYALSDLEKAIAISPAPEYFDLKAFALFQIGRYKEVIQLYETYPYKDELSKDTKKIYENAIRANKREEELEKHKKEIKKKEKSEKALLISALKKNGLKIGARLHNIPQILDAKICLDSKGKLHFPAIIMYEESMSCDFIKDIPEDSTLQAQLGEILNQGLPWDSAHKYYLENIETYFEINMTKPLDSEVKIKETKEKFKKCDMNAKIIDVIKDEYYIIPQVLVFYVVAKGTEFYKMFLNNQLC